MFRKSITLICFLYAAFVISPVQAAIIHYNGHSLNTSTNIITSGELQWLRWDETEGMSVDEALKKYSQQGWRTPTHKEVAIMLNTFNFGVQWDDDPKTNQEVKNTTDTELQQEVLKFFSLFGATACSTAPSGSATCIVNPYDEWYAFTAGLIFDDTSGSESVQQFTVDQRLDQPDMVMQLGTDKDFTTIFDARPGKGVMLVRDVKPFVGDDLGSETIRQDQKDFIKIASNDKAYNSLFGGMFAPLSDSRYYLPCHDDTRTQITSNTINTTLSASENCFFIPELDDEVVIGFFNNYRPQFSVIKNITAELSGNETAMEELILIVMQSIAKMMKNEKDKGSGIMLPIIGLGSFVGNTWPGSGELSKNNYDYHFIANKNVARNYLAGFGHSTLDGMIAVVSSMGIPKPLIDQVKKDLADNGKFIKIAPIELIETVLLHVIAGEIGANRVTKAGPTYLYQQRDSDKNGTVDSCWASPTTSNLAKSYVKEVGEQSLCYNQGLARDPNIIQHPAGYPAIGAFRVEISGVDAGNFSSCSILLDTFGDIMSFTTDPGTTITMFSCPGSREQ